MTLLFHGLWMLCAFGAAVFAAVAIRGWWSGAFAVAGFVLGATAAGPAHVPDSAWLGVLAALVATLGLAWPRHSMLTSLAAGACAGVWASLFRVQGLPVVPALAAAATVPVVAAWLAAKRPRFAPAVLRDEALLAVFVLGIAIAIAPGVLEGWQSALALNLDAKSPGQSVPAWTLLLAGVSVVCGGLYSLWSRR